MTVFLLFLLAEALTRGVPVPEGVAVTGVVPGPEVLAFTATVTLLTVEPAGIEIPKFENRRVPVMIENVIASMSGWCVCEEEVLFTTKRRSLALVRSAIGRLATSV